MFPFSRCLHVDRSQEGGEGSQVKSTEVIAYLHHLVPLWLSFHLDLLGKSEWSWKVTVFAFCVLKATRCVTVCNTALWRCGGQSLMCDRYSHSSFSKLAPIVVSHWYHLWPHSVIRCLSVSGMLHMLQASVRATCMWWRHSCVGTIYGFMDARMSVISWRKLAYMFCGSLLCISLTISKSFFILSFSAFTSFSM